MQALSTSNSGFLVGANLTLADVGLMEALLAIVDFYGDQKLNAYAEIKVTVLIPVMFTEFFKRKLVIVNNYKTL